MAELTEKINWMLFEIHKKRWISLSKDDPEIIFNAKAKLQAFGLIERQNKLSWKLTKDGYDAVDLGGFEEWKLAKNQDKKKPSNIKSNNISNMKIFISHSSKNSDYGNAIVELLIRIGIKNEQIIYTSNTAYGIPIGQNIFNWLKDRINEKPHVIYLLSTEYYSSIACLNEMGAAWVIENQHTMIFTPNFRLDSYEFQNGAIDPRELGFFLYDKERLTSFIETLINSFGIKSNLVFINQQIDSFIKNIKKLENEQKNTDNSITTNITSKANIIDSNEPHNSTNNLNNKSSIKPLKRGSSRLFPDLRNGKLKTEEILLVHYIIDTARFKLGAGWQESKEIENIEAWEDVNELDSILSKNYSKALKKLEMRALTEVSEVTSSGNPKEMTLLLNVREELLDLPDDIHKIILNTLKNNPAKNNPTKEDYPSSPL